MDGIYYSLPRTVLKLDEPVERTRSVAGKFRVYLPLFYPRIAEAKSFVDKTQTKYEVKKASFSAFGEPDPDQVYYAKITGGGPIDRTAFMQYTEQGSVSGAEAGADNATSDILLSGLTAAVGIATRSFGAVGVPPTRPGCPATDTSVPCRILRYAGVDPIDSKLLLVNYDQLGKKAKQAINDAAANNNPNFDSALEAYAHIEKLRTERNTLRSKETALSVDAQLKDYDAVIATDTAYFFTGTETKDTWTASFELRPGAVSDKIELMRVDPNNGVCVTADLRGKDNPPKKFWLDPALLQCDETRLRAAITAELDRARTRPNPDPDLIKAIQARLDSIAQRLQEAKRVIAAFALDPPNQAFAQVGAAFQDKGERSFRYIIPANTKVALTWGDDPAGESRQQVAQFGLVASLPASSGGKSLNYALAFYESTGALKSFKLASKAVLQRGTLDTISTQANALIDARRKAEDELTALDHQQKVMAAKKSIYDNCKALNMACGGYVPPPPAPQQPQ